MKRLTTILLITVALGLIAYAYIWIENEKVAISVSDFPTRIIPKKKVVNPTTTSGDVMSGMMASGAVASGAMEGTGTMEVSTGTAAVATGN